jgi:hypothetical protein
MKEKIKRIMSNLKRKFTRWPVRNLGVTDPERSQTHSILRTVDLNNYIFMRDVYTDLQNYRKKYHPGQFYDDEIPEKLFFFLCNFYDYHNVKYEIKPRRDYKLLIIENDTFWIDDDTEMLRWMLYKTRHIEYKKK